MQQVNVFTARHSIGFFFSISEGFHRNYDCRGCCVWSYWKKLPPSNQWMLRACWRSVKT